MKIKITESNGILGKSVWPTATATWRDSPDAWPKLEPDTEIEKKLYKQLHKHFGAILKKGPPLDSESVDAIKQILSSGDYAHVFKRCPKGTVQRGIKAPIEWVMKHAPEAYNSIPTDRGVIDWSEVIPVNFTYKPQGQYGEISSWTGDSKIAKQFSTKYKPDSVSVVLHAECSSGFFLGTSGFKPYKGGIYQYDDEKPIKKLNPNPHERELLLIGDCEIIGIQFRGPKKTMRITKEDVINMIDEELEQILTEKCWPGYEKKGMKKMFGKMYPNCVKKKKKKKKNEEVELEEKEDRKGASAAYCKRTPCDEMGFTQKASCKSQGIKDCYRGKKKNESITEADPKKGTGKKPKGSGRRLYTDENPSDTVSVKFRTVSDIRDTLSKDSFKNKSHKRQSQIINLIHQRARAAYQNAKDPDTKARLKKAYDYAKKRKEASKEKTKRMRKDEAESYHWNEPNWFYGGTYGEKATLGKEKTKRMRKNK